MGNLRGLKEDDLRGRSLYSVRRSIHRSLNLFKRRLGGACLSRARLSGACLGGACLSGACLGGVSSKIITRLDDNLTCFIWDLCYSKAGIQFQRLLDTLQITFKGSKSQLAVIDYCHVVQTFYWY